MLETLAALVLLALIAGACARLLIDERAFSRHHAAPPGPSMAGGADLIAELVVEDPAAFGLPAVEALDTRCRALTPTPEMARRVQAVGVDPSSIRARLLPVARVDPTPMGGERRRASTSVGPARRTARTLPHWLVVHVGDEIAVRCVNVRESGGRS